MLELSYLLAPKISYLDKLIKKTSVLISDLLFIYLQNFMLSWVEHEQSFKTSGAGSLGLTNSED